ncbi:MAG: XRE family transcriptional regulator [Bacteroidetes bacterium]|nr:MAG: XRE family transcriptional regulator [Bacteroidota bacterium]
MKERILEFLKTENKSSAQLAEEIGVQASGISHIISGRNNPSLDFILKMLEKYQFLSSDWLLFGKGSMYKDPKMNSLFEDNIAAKANIERTLSDDKDKRPELEFQQVTNEEQPVSSVIAMDKDSNVTKIVWFYENHSFEEYFPGKK